MSDSPVSTRVVNEAFYNKLTSDDTGLRKEAADIATKFTRMRMREESYSDKILPPEPITNADLTKSVRTDKNVMVIEREPGSPAAVSVPYGMLPSNRYIKSNRYEMVFARIESPRFTKDVSELRSYDMDIRQVLSDNSIKDLLAEQDGKFLTACNLALGTRDSANESGVALWQAISGPLTRSYMGEAKKIMTRSFARLSPATALINHTSLIDFEKWQRDQVGGDLAEDILVNGFSERTFLGVKWITTIKNEQVAEGTVYWFAEPKFLGRNCVLEDTTMYIDRRYFMLEFFAYKELGAIIGNVAAVARTDFTGSAYVAQNLYT